MPHRHDHGSSEAHLLNGPQAEDKALHQDHIDVLLDAASGITGTLQQDTNTFDPETDIEWRDVSEVDHAEPARVAIENGEASGEHAGPIGSNEIGGEGDEPSAMSLHNSSESDAETPEKIGEASQTSEITEHADSAQGSENIVTSESSTNTPVNESSDQPAATHKKPPTIYLRAPSTRQNELDTAPAEENSDPQPEPVQERELLEAQAATATDQIKEPDTDREQSLCSLNELDQTVLFG